MTITEKYIVETYSNLFEGLNSISKNELLQKLSKSIKNERKNSEKEFFKSFGAFGSSESAEEISKKIKESKKFKRLDLKL